MVASTNIKFYVHTNNNAPQLQNAYGSMINVLDACLIDGIQIGAVNSLTAVGSTVTATFGAAHNLMQYQVIKITGANQPEFNGEHRILTIPDSSSLTFELAAAPSVSTATGTISASLPPLGWEKPFSSSNPNGGGKAAYRSLNLLLPSRPFLRVVDELDPAYTATYAKYAKVGIVEDMTDIDTMLGVQTPFDAVNPDKNWVATGSGTTVINGWARWYYARNTTANAANAGDSTPPSAGSRPFILIGTKDVFYILCGMTTSDNSKLVYGFGAFESLIPADISNTFLSSTLMNIAANVSMSRASNTPLANSIASLALQRNHLQQMIPVFSAKAISIKLGTNSVDYSGEGDWIDTPSNANQIPCADVFVTDGSLRGKLPLMKWLFQKRPYTNYNFIDYGEQSYIALDVASGSSASIGQILIRVI